MTPPVESQNWFESVKKAEKVGLIKDGKRKIHYRFREGVEMVEEYSLDTDVLLKRAWKKKSTLGVAGAWETEIGDQEALPEICDTFVIKESSTTPFITRRITKTNLEWRIRNLPYPLEVYMITAEPENKSITVRTSNKKYFKKLEIPDLERVGLQPEQERIKYTHQHQTLIITYQKPPELLQLEKKTLEEIKKVQVVNEKDADKCNPS